MYMYVGMYLFMYMYIFLRFQLVALQSPRKTKLCHLDRGGGAIHKLYIYICIYMYIYISAARSKSLGASLPSISAGSATVASEAEVVPPR